MGFSRKLHDKMEVLIMAQKHPQLRRYSWFLFKLVGVFWIIAILIVLFFHHLSQVYDNILASIISFSPVIMAFCLITIMSSKLIERINR